MYRKIIKVTRYGNKVKTAYDKRKYESPLRNGRFPQLKENICSGSPDERSLFSSIAMILEI